jgi:hypothetical protein
MVQQFSLLPFNLSKIEIFYVISAHNTGHECRPVCADLLTKDYTYDHKLVISTVTQSGLVRAQPSKAHSLVGSKWHSLAGKGNRMWTFALDFFLTVLES